MNPINDYWEFSCNFHLEKGNGKKRWRRSGKEEVTVHINDAEATEDSKHCTMKFYGLQFWLMKLKKVPFCYRLNLTCTLQSAPSATVEME